MRPPMAGPPGGPAVRAGWSQEGTVRGENRGGAGLRTDGLGPGGVGGWYEDG